MKMGRRRFLLITLMIIICFLLYNCARRLSTSVAAHTSHSLKVCIIKKSIGSLVLCTLQIK